LSTAAFDCSRSGVAKTRFGGLFFSRGFDLGDGLLDRRRQNTRKLRPRAFTGSSPRAAAGDVQKRSRHVSDVVLPLTLGFSCCGVCGNQMVVTQNQELWFVSPSILTTLPGRDPRSRQTHRGRVLGGFARSKDSSSSLRTVTPEKLSHAQWSRERFLANVACKEEGVSSGGALWWLASSESPPLGQRDSRASRRSGRRSYG